MSQFVHKIANTYLDMPTDYWVPTTNRIRPMYSHQWAAGIYTRFGPHWTGAVEAYYKESYNLVQYVSWMGLEPPAASWDRDIMSGRGRFHGIETDVTYRNKNLTLTTAYTLSWSKRYFPRFYRHWFYDKFDNRHKLNLSLRYRFSQKCSAFAVWTVNSGNRVTVPTQYVPLPHVPSGHNNGIPQYHFYEDNDKTPEYGYVYKHPNNTSLPTYHRLDAGLDFRRFTKRGHERILNVSVYNIYHHLNPLYVKIKRVDDGSFRAQPKGFIPIIPSVSYTVKF